LLTQTRCQCGSLRTKKIVKGPSAWQFRYYETIDGSQIRKRATIGIVEQRRTEAAARQAVAPLLMKLNSKAPGAGAETPAAMIYWHVEEELPGRFSTQISYCRWGTCTSG
jgi:hypothetical protein